MSKRRDLPQGWSDQVLDDTLRSFNSSVTTNSEALQAARRTVMEAANQLTVRDNVRAPLGVAVSSAAAVHRGRRRTSRLLIAAAVVAVMVMGGLLASSLSWNGKTPAASAAAAQALDNASSTVVKSTPLILKPGQFEYVQTSAWWAAFNGDFVFLTQNLIQTWIPSDVTTVWLQLRHATNNHQWIKGTEKDARAAGVLIDGIWPTTRASAACGNFSDTVEPGQGCSAAGSWQHPTPSFVANLPNSARQIYNRLLADTPDNGDRAFGMLQYAADALQSEALPATTRALLYQSLAEIPGIELTDNTANLDGRLGIAFGVASSTDVRLDVIIDPVTGTFIGQRQVLTSDRDGTPKGTVITFSAVNTAVVSRAGQVPAS